MKKEEKEMKPEKVRNEYKSEKSNQSSKDQNKSETWGDRKWQPKRLKLTTVMKSSKNLAGCNAYERTAERCLLPSLWETAKIVIDYSMQQAIGQWMVETIKCIVFAWEGMDVHFGMN